MKMACDQSKDNVTSEPWPLAPSTAYLNSTILEDMLVTPPPKGNYIRKMIVAIELYNLNNPVIIEV
jgi:hypothetical protein